MVHSTAGPWADLMVALMVDQLAVKTVDEKVVVMAGHSAVAVVGRSDARSVVVMVAKWVAVTVDQLAALMA